MFLLVRASPVATRADPYRAPEALFEVAQVTEADLQCDIGNAQALPIPQQLLGVLDAQLLQQQLERRAQLAAEQESQV